MKVLKKFKEILTDRCFMNVCNMSNMLAGPINVYKQAWAWILAQKH